MDSIFGKDYLLNVEQAHFLVYLAMRQSDGRAALHCVIDIRRDDEEIYFIPEELSGSSSTQHEPMNASTMHRWFENQPSWCATAPWYAVIAEAEIEGGGTIRSNDPIVAMYWPPRRNELWLLAGTREEWLTAQNEIKVPEGV